MEPEGVRDNAPLWHYRKKKNRTDRNVPILLYRSQFRFKVPTLNCLLCSRLMRFLMYNMSKSVVILLHKTRRQTNRKEPQQMFFY